MSWSTFHVESSRLADSARAAQWRGDMAEAQTSYLAAARAELLALQEVGADKPRTYGITAVSAAALFCKGKEFAEARKIAEETLPAPFLPTFAKVQLQEILETVKREKNTERRDKLDVEPALPDKMTATRQGAVDATDTFGELDSQEPIFDLIELFFFAYRDFVRDADRLLEQYRFGRAHHRVLHFVNRRPGLAVAALLDILKITKQSLNRVFKQLLDAGFVEQRAGASDRRQRLLYPTVKGARLAHELSALQSARLSRVLGSLHPRARGAATEFLLAIVNADEREAIRNQLPAASFTEAPVWDVHLQQTQVDPPTTKRAEVAQVFVTLRSERFVRVLDTLRPETRAEATNILLAMIDEDDRERVLDHLSRTHGETTTGKAP